MLHHYTIDFYYKNKNNCPQSIATIKFTIDFHVGHHALLSSMAKTMHAAIDNNLLHRIVKKR